MLTISVAFRLKEEIKEVFVLIAEYFIDVVRRGFDGEVVQLLVRDIEGEFDGAFCELSMSADILCEFG